MTETDEKFERRLLPIYSCKDCSYIYVDKSSAIPMYNTFCTHLAGQTRAIKYGTEPTPEHFKFPKWCILTKEE